MPIIQSAKKKLHQDKQGHTENLLTKNAMKQAIRLAHKEFSQKTLKVAFSAIDTAAKKKVIHDNKAARLKSQLARLDKKTSKATA